MDYYNWIKAFHIISVICWMAGLLYLPRLFVYHSAIKSGSELSETFKVMERRLNLFITNPSMIFTFVFGIWLIFLSPEILEQHWMQWKIIGLVGMTGIHGAFSRWRRFFERDENIFSTKFYKWINEVPTVLMIAIVILAVVKP